MYSHSLSSVYWIVIAMPLKEEASSNTVEGCISLGPWGDEKAGEPWSYLLNGYIIKVTIQCDSNNAGIYSIHFQTLNHKGGQLESSKKFGGPDGRAYYVTTQFQFCIDTQVEQLESLDITMKYNGSYTYISSLTFRTNFAMHGPFGTKSGDAVSIPMTGGVIVGFHGRAKTYLNAIGVCVMPTRSYFTPTDQNQEAHVSQRTGFMKLAFPRDIGPWGSKGGKRWDDGVFTHIRQVCVFCSNASGELQGIQIEYEKPDGNLIWSPLHGGNDNCPPSLISIQWVDEEFVGIEGYIGNFANDTNGSVGVKSITLYTNKGKYGPFGVENGEHFMSSLTGGKIVGFWGSSGTHLNSIGVHMLYL